MTRAKLFPVIKCTHTVRADLTNECKDRRVINSIRASGILMQNIQNDSYEVILQARGLFSKLGDKAHGPFEIEPNEHWAPLFIGEPVIAKNVVRIKTNEKNCTKSYFYNRLFLNL